MQFSGLALLPSRVYPKGMTTTKNARGLYRTGTYDSGATYAYVTDGTQGFEINEATYRGGAYVPAYDALPTKEEYEANGGKVA
jgi:hypothetical protein